MGNTQPSVDEKQPSPPQNHQGKEAKLSVGGIYHYRRWMLNDGNVSHKPA
jgi:hypothetical protein